MKMSLLTTLALLLLALPRAQAQPKPMQQPPTAEPKKLSAADSAVLTPKYGSLTNESKVFLSTFKQVLNLELKAVDKKQVVYTVVSYRLGWRKKEMSDDWRTGKKKPVYTFSAVEVNNSAKIPAAWQKEMAEMLQAGDEIYFEEILAQQTKGGPVFKSKALKLKLL